MYKYDHEKWNISEQWRIISLIPSHISGRASTPTYRPNGARERRPRQKISSKTSLKLPKREATGMGGSQTKKYFIRMSVSFWLYQINSGRSQRSFPDSTDCSKNSLSRPTRVLIRRTRGSLYARMSNFATEKGMQYCCSPFRICLRYLSISKRLLLVQVYTSDAKDQGICSACSAFSTVAALETCVQRFASDSFNSSWWSSEISFHQ